MNVFAAVNNTHQRTPEDIAGVLSDNILAFGKEHDLKVKGSPHVRKQTTGTIEYSFDSETLNKQFTGNIELRDGKIINSVSWEDCDASKKLQGSFKEWSKILAN